MPEEPLYVHGDRTRLLQVFSNLVQNAHRYTPRAGHTVRLKVTGRTRWCESPTTALEYRRPCSKRSSSCSRKSTLITSEPAADLASA